MAFQKGKKRTGGRRKGTPNKATAKRVEAIAQSGLTPLEYMLNLMRNEDNEPHIRLDAAKSAAPYVHSKLAAIEMTGKDGKDLMPEKQTHEMSGDMKVLFDRYINSLQSLRPAKNMSNVKD